MSDEQAAPRVYDFDELYPGRFLKGGDFARTPRTLTIARVQLEELEGEKGKRKRGIVRFQEESRELVLNKTNGLLLRAMFGRSTEAWVGRRVTFAFDADVKLGGKVVGGIRIVGSPEITEAREVEIALPRKRPFTVTIQPTGQRAAASKRATLSAEQKSVITARRARYAELTRGDGESADAALERARQTLGDVLASTFAGWVERADRMIADREEPRATAADDDITGAFVREAREPGAEG